MVSFLVVEGGWGWEGLMKDDGFYGSRHADLYVENR